ncbi:replication initiation protein RepM [Moraxella osloensis]|uniref:replication initiation protein RepM n=1 Tax=Faucicola osloensis TaxID=34062 RepID=UPI0034DE5645
MNKSKNDLVVKDNALINASYYLSLTEQRLILLAIIQARAEKKTTGNEFKVKVSSYINAYGVADATAYEAIQKATETLRTRYFTFERVVDGEPERVVSNWVQSIAYAENSSYIKIKFTDDVMPLITKLEKHFTSYQLEQVKDLTSIYAIRLYEMIIQWRATGKTQQIPIDELRYKLGIEPDQYKQMVNFKKKVLDFAINQINEHTDIKASYEQHKEGRSITGFTFTFKEKPKPKAKGGEVNRDDKTGDLFSIGGLSDAQLARITRNEQFKKDYGDMVSPNSLANTDANEWTKEMIKRLKSTPELFTKGDIKEYLN